jgi:opacity protein-like surface antigen
MRLFLLIALIGISMSSPAYAAEEQVIQEASSSGNQHLPSIAVPDNWEIRWDLKGQSLTVHLYDGEGHHVGIAGKQQGPGKGTAVQRQGGTYVLKVEADGEWTVIVVQRP